MIRIIPRKEIDVTKYQKCLEDSDYPNIYANSWWLDIVHPEWELVCKNDYESVMPLTQKRRFFQKKLVQPIFTQQLGIFCNPEYLFSISKEYIHFLKKKNIEGYQQWNDQQIEIRHDHEEVGVRNNYILELQEGRDQFYRSSHKRSIKKAIKAKTELRAISIKEFLTFFKSHNPYFNQDILPHFRKFTQLIEYAYNNKHGIPTATFIDGEMTACIFWGIQESRAYYLFPAVNKRGKESGSTHYLIDQVQELIPEAKIIDFEGSDVEGVAHFIQGFGAMLQPYPTIKIS